MKLLYCMYVKKGVYNFLRIILLHECNEKRVYLVILTIGKNLRILLS